MSMINPVSKEYPSESDLAGNLEMAYMPPGCTVKPGRRVYRYIDAPEGCSLYWDQPQLVAAVNLGGKYKEAAYQYIREYLKYGMTKTNVLLWGNHYYFDSLRNAFVKFKGDTPPVKVDFENERGELHELRPVVPAWDLFWDIDAQRIEEYLYALIEMHLFDREKGGFNRHADNESGCAFLEAGGILAETFCWLYGKTKDEKLLDTALRIARWSFSYQGQSTGLLENNPTVTRWDKYVSTTECGLWAGCLLRAGEYSGTSEFKDMAKKAVDAYLRYGWSKEGMLYGRLFVKDGRPDTGEKETLFQPGIYSSPVNPIFPAHDYPYSFMETCIALYREFKDDQYRRAVERWLAIAGKEVLDESKVLYAEFYGRLINLALSAERAMALNTDDLPTKTARRAIDDLFNGEMFIGHSHSKAYNCVDGTGYLLLSLMNLQSGKEPALFGFSF
jgi:hypothetical protein